MCPSLLLFLICQHFIWRSSLEALSAAQGGSAARSEIATETEASAAGSESLESLESRGSRGSSGSSESLESGGGVESRW